jgi:plastocyanin
MRRTGISAIALVATLVLAGCAGDTGGASPAPATPEPATPGAPSAACSTGGGSAAVAAQIRGFAFTPNPLAVKVGDIVGWTNADSVAHTVTMDDGSCTTGSLGEGATGLLVFEVPGTYPFHCRFHPSMTGTVEVTE